MPVIVEPWRIPADGEAVDGEVQPESMGLDALDDIHVTGAIVYELHLQKPGMELIVNGSLSTRAKLVCSRCATEFERDIRDDSFFCEKQLSDLHAPVDLTEEVRESIILAFPTYPICESACRGLCPRCGANRNREQCGCSEQAETTGSVFDSLDVMERKHHGRTQKEKIKK